MTAERMPPDESPLSRPLAWLTELTLRHPAAMLWGAALLTLVSLVVTLNGLKFKTSRLDLLNPESRYNQRWLAYLDEFGSRDDAVIVIRADNAAAVTAAIEDVAKEVSQQPHLFESVLWRRDLSRVKAKGLQLLPPQELNALSARLRTAAAALDETGPGSAPVDALVRLNEQLERFPSLSPQQRQALEQQYAQLGGMLLAATNPSTSTQVRQASLEGADPAAGVTRDLLAGLSHLDPQYLLSDEGRMGFVLLKFAAVGNEFARGGKAIGRLREIVDTVRSRQRQAWIGLTGMPVIEYDEMRISQWDMLWTNVVSLAGCVLLFVAGYGGIRHAGMATAVLLVGMAWSFAFVTLAVGHLNILSSAFAIVLIGLGIDFGIHYVARYLKLRGEGLDAHASLLQTATDVGPGVVTSGVTTAAAFFMAALTQFVGVRELGIIAGGGILLCVLSAVVVLPPLILVFDRDRPMVQMPSLLPVATWLSWLHTRPGLVLSMAVLATVVSAVGITRLRYDHNLLHLQPSHVESVEIEQEMFATEPDSVWFAVSICGSRQELKRRKEIFERLPSVAKTEEIASLIPEPDRRRLKAVAEIHEALVRLFDERTASSGARRATAAVHQEIDVVPLVRELKRGAALLGRDLPSESQTAQLLSQSAASLQRSPPAQVAAAFAQLDEQSREHLRQSAAALAPLLEFSDPAPLMTSDLPRELADRYVGRTSKHLLKIYARGDIWDMERLERFVADLEAVDPLVTGHPVQTYYASRHLQLSYVHAGAFALMAVFALLLFDFRSIRYSLLAMIPLAMGFLQMCGMIGWFGIPLNAANLIALPLILGIGVDDGVHLVHDLRRRGGRFRLTDSTGVAVILISTTTMASFGALILARHQGLRSLGQVLTLGTFLCLTCSMLVFPALLRWLTRHLPELPEEEEPSRREDKQAADQMVSVELPSASVPTLAIAEPAEDRPALAEATQSLVPDRAPMPRAIAPRRRAG